MAKDTTPVAAVDHAAAADPATPPGPYDDYPGKTMGVIALVLAFFTQIPALILGIIAWVWSKNAGISNVPAKVAVAVSSAFILLGLLALVGWVILVASAFDGLGELGGFGPMGPRFLDS